MSKEPVPAISPDCDALIQQLSRVNDPSRMHELLFDFVRNSPLNEEALLKVLYEGSSILSEVQLDAINSALMEAIQSDQNLCSANAIKEFTSGLKRNTRKFFDDLLQTEFFPEVILAGSRREIELPERIAQQLDPYDSPTYDEVNVWLEELSLRIHLENGKPYNQLSIEQRGTKVFLKVAGPAEQLTMESYTAEELKRFRSVMTSSHPQERYESRYHDIGVKQIAIITHGNSRTVRNLQGLISNLEKFGHRNICITIFDDKEDDANSSNMREKIRAVAAPAGIEVRYVGWAERHELINALTTLMGEDKRTDVEACIGKDTGTGGNRNHVALRLGKQNYLSLDDDIETGVETLVDGTTKSIQVDLLTIASRHIRPPTLLAADFRYTGHLDNAGIGCIGVFLNERALSSPVDSWYRAYNSAGAPCWDSIRDNSTKLIYDHRFSNVISGGAVCFPAGYNGLIARQPTIVSTEFTGRNQDVFLSVLPQTILEQAGIPPSIFSSAASAVQHNREINLRNTDLVKNSLEENAGQFIACIVTFLMHESPEVRKAIFSGSAPFQNMPAVLSALSNEIKKLASMSDQERLESLVTVRVMTVMFTQEIKDLFKMYVYKGVLAHPDAAGVRQEEMIALQRNPARRESYMKLLSDLEKNFSKFFGEDLARVPTMTETEVDLLIFKKILQNTMLALQKYGQSLSVWNDMVAAHDARLS